MGCNHAQRGRVGTFAIPKSRRRCKDALTNWYSDGEKDEEGYFEDDKKNMDFGLGGTRMVRAGGRKL